MLEGEKNVISIIYYLYDLVCWKIFYIWLKSILGNHEITLYGYFLSGDINWNGGRRINVYSFSAIDHWWNYRTCNITFLNLCNFSRELNDVNVVWDLHIDKEGQ